MHPAPDAPKRKAVSQRFPAMLVAIAVAVGIAADKWGDVTWQVWLLVAMGCAIGWMACWFQRYERSATCLLILACAAVGAARHHQFWSTAEADDLSQFASTDRKLVRLTGTVSEQPWIRRVDPADWKSAVPQIDQTQCVVAAHSIETSRGTVTVSGRVRLTVSGHLLHVAVGDEVRAVGWLSTPRPPGNPGQFDFGEHLRRQQCRSLLFANHPDAVSKVANGRFQPTFLLAQFRDAAERMCVVHLSKQNVPLATALLLGERSRMTDDLRESFAKSGTAHILAISGLHVGILAALLWLVCRLLNASPGMTATAIVTGVMLYAVVSGGRPPVSRATVFVLIAVGGFLLKRPAVAMNTLALAAIAVLAWNPSDLFDVGTQLSFLAVCGIIVAQQWQPVERAGDPLAEETSNRWRNGVRNLGNWLLRGYAMMCGIWLLTVPLTAARFHLVSPIGFVINVVLIPFVCLLMWTGFAFLLLGMLVPFAAVPLGVAFDTQLSGLLWVVDFAAKLRLGHLYGPGPSTPWIVVYYLLIAGLVFALLRRWQVRRVVLTLVVWSVAGLAIGWAPQERDGLRCTFLDMGHGCAVLLELPNGRTLLYDAGSLTDANRAERTVETALWARGIARLDGAIASHADVDHFNGLHGLLERIPVGTVMMSQRFLDFEQRSVRELCDVIERRQIPVRLLQMGDNVRLDEQVAITVLHPPGDARFAGDNENSLVLLVEYAGRRILLTGDLEREGQRRLLQSEPRSIDVMLSPHHGSRAANPPGLADWAGPRWVVVGTQDERLLPYLSETYGKQTQIVTTGEYGAVTFEIRSDGTIVASGGRKSIDAAKTNSYVR